MSLPSRAIVPAVGARKPDSMLKKVVLPAPFGPMTAKRLPSGTSRSISLLATRPSKRLVRPRTERSAIGSALPARRLLANIGKPGEPLGHVDQHQDQRERIQDVLEAACRAHDLRQQRGNDGAEGRTESGADVFVVLFGVGFV